MAVKRSGSLFYRARSPCSPSDAAVYGDASSKELINFLTTGAGARAAPADKVDLWLWWHW